MDRDTDFYVYLISDGSSHVYKDNKISSFKILLPRQLRLNKSFRVCLKQIHFPTDIVEQSFKLLLNPSHYHNSLLPVQLDTNFDAQVIEPDDSFDDVATVSQVDKEAVAQKHNFGKQLYVYTDIIQPVAVASDYIPLLTVVPFNNTGLFEPQHPVYHKLLGQELQTISIWIRDHLALPVQFRNGRVIILLHFVSV